MSHTQTHPLAEYPIEASAVRPGCSRRRTDPDFLTLVMLEHSLAHAASLVQGLVLDVGCGMRPYELTHFKGARTYLGMDYLSDRSLPHVHASALDLPFKNSTFDTLVSTEVLEHVPAPERVLREMLRVIKPSGHLILSCPMYWPRHEMPYDYFRYPYDGLLHLLQANGWELVKCYNRGRSYAFLGQVMIHVAPRILQLKPLIYLLNTFFLWADRRRKNDQLSLGWTVIARPAPRVPTSAL